MQLACVQWPRLCKVAQQQPQQIKHNLRKEVAEGDCPALFARDCREGTLRSMMPLPLPTSFGAGSLPPSRGSSTTAAAQEKKGAFSRQCDDVC
ncbi:hypothetical protein cyc_02020 [Cyclospora cayetanensis]|uniref:Uncharacterized protein n=1 Tax=Cyclospora cayetanensis TaxID=88456 RepID=A0A1D3CW97_9EIME|nr:hypothetical protein cyc_02020 [Cyclospora cayetanensis]